MYVIRFITILLACLFGSLTPVAAQQYCPININFELGNLSHWSFDTGHNLGAAGITSTRIPAPLANRDSLTSTSDTDFYGGFPIVDPVGGLYSLRLGNSLQGAEVDIARYTFTIPSNVNNYSLTYRYAVVFQDPSHLPYEQPFFSVRVYNASTKATINCASFTYTATSNLPGFRKSTHVLASAPVYYKSWTPVSLNLSGQAGETLVFEVTSADCSQTGHFGYGYVDVSCGLFSVYNPDSNGCRYAIRLSAPSGYQTYMWYDSSFTHIIDSGQNISIQPPATLTKYNVVFFPYPGYGCPDTLSVRTFGRKPLAIDAGPDTSVCMGGHIMLHPSGGQRYEWGTNSTLSCSQCTTPIAIPIATTTYTVIGSDSNGCSGVDTIVIASTRITINAGIDTQVCAGSSIMLSPSGAKTYLWLPDSSLSCLACATPAATPHSSSTYIVTGTDSNGCVAIDSVFVRVVQPVEVGTDTTASICLGDSVRLGAYGGLAWHWLPPVSVDRADRPDPIVTPAATTIYRVAIIENECFTDTLLQKIIIVPPPVVSLGPDREGLVGETISIHANVDVSAAINWLPAQGLSCYSCASPQYIITDTATYVAIATNDFGCIGTDTIHIDKTCRQGTFFFPNTFTPNSDGANDYFYPRGSGLANVLRFNIYDRLGELVYSATNFPLNTPKAGWDGTYKNVPAHPGVYVYVMHILCELNKPVEITGDISLVR